MMKQGSRALNILSFAFSTYTVLIALGTYTIFLAFLAPYITIPEFLMLSSQQHMSLFLAGTLLLALLFKPSRGNKIRWYDILLALIAFLGPFYRFLVYPFLVLRMGITTLPDIIFGLITIIFILEATRRGVGTALAAITLFFVLYGLADVNFDIETFTERVYLYNVGIFSIPLEVAVFLIFVFIFFGHLLNELGVMDFFIKLALALTGHKRGGPAKVAVLASSLVGTTTGSATGNVTITGTFTIPAMKRVGYKPEVAGAIEAAASTGGQIMPPVLGSAAFIMPLFLGTTYWNIVLASIIPALLYYLSLYLYVDLNAMKEGLRGLPKGELPSLKEPLKKAYYLLPIIALVMALAMGFAPQHSALIALMIALIIAAFEQGIKRGLGYFIALLIIILIANRLGLGYLGIVLLGGGIAILTMLVIGVLIHGYRETARKTYLALTRAFIGMIPITLACASAGVIAGVITLTGLSQTIGRFLIQLSGGNEVILLALTMIAAIILGFGLPTPVVYVLCVTMLVTALSVLKVPLLASHFFIFYFGVFAPLTPPVALTAYAAAAIARSDMWKTGLEAFKLTITSWVIAYAFIFKPEMLLVTVPNWDLNALANLAIGVVGALIALIALQFTLIGYWYFVKELSIIERVISGIGALMALAGIYYTNVLLLLLPAAIIAAIILFKQLLIGKQIK